MRARVMATHHQETPSQKLTSQVKLSSSRSMHSTSAAINSGGGRCFSVARPWMVLESARGGKSGSLRRQQAVKSCVCVMHWWWWRLAKGSSVGCVVEIRCACGRTLRNGWPGS